MERKRFRWWIIPLTLALTGLVVWVGIVWATARVNTGRGYEAESFAQLAADSDVVVLAISGSPSYLSPEETSDGRPMVLTSVNVVRCYKGFAQTGKSILFLQRDTFQDPPANDGDTLLLFLKVQLQGDLQIYSPLGQFDGQYRVQGDVVRSSLALNEKMEADLDQYGHSLLAIEKVLDGRSGKSGAASASPGTSTPAPEIVRTEPPVTEPPISDTGTAGTGATEPPATETPQTEPPATQTPETQGEPTAAR